MLRGTGGGALSGAGKLFAGFLPRGELCKKDEQTTIQTTTTYLLSRSWFSRTGPLLLRFWTVNIGTTCARGGSRSSNGEPST
jgi:hypothetical protein